MIQIQLPAWLRAALLAVSLLAPLHHMPTDATSVNTPHWVCLRFNESTNGKLDSNIYQIQNPTLMRTIGMARAASTYTRAEQNVFALRAYAYDQRVWGIGNGFHAWKADYVVCDL